MPNRFSEYIVFVDESGDHGLKSIDPNYPMFVLAFCIFRKTEYATTLVPDLKHFKFKHFGHDQVILHETDIRKDRGDFSILKTREKKEAFLTNCRTSLRPPLSPLSRQPSKRRRYWQDTPIPTIPIMWPWVLVWNVSIFICEGSARPG